MSIVISRCPVCYDRLDAGERHSRVAIRCGHAICFGCLLLVIAVAAPNQRRVMCPVCRTPFRVPHETPRDHSMIRVIERMNPRGT